MAAPLARSLRVLVVYGTRPEAIKMAPVVAALRARAERFEPIVCTTAQHREMIDQVQELFGLAPDLDLDLMTPDQGLNELTARVITALDEVLERVRPDWLLVQGDTTTAMGAALAAFHHRIPVGHVEAGLRKGDLTQPFPEEANRRLIDIVAQVLFAPTARARDALLTEGADPDRLFLTGNTIVDALQSVAATLGDTCRHDESWLRFIGARALANRSAGSASLWPSWPNIFRSCGGSTRCTTIRVCATLRS
jgi:UDP-N-acetylglucosamine 2-epimerase (non-hydrolysing)